MVDHLCVTGGSQKRIDGPHSVKYSPSSINMFLPETYPDEKCNDNGDTTVRYHDNDEWPAHPPVCLWFNYGILNDFLKEWLIEKMN